MNVVVVTEPGDPRLADYATLTDAQLRKRYEQQHGVLIAEGPNPVRELVRSRYPVRSLLVARERLHELDDLAGRLGSDVAVYVVSRELLYETVRFRLHQGLLACGSRRPARSPSDVLSVGPRAVLLEGLNDHENLGTLFRSVRGLGWDSVLLGPGCADPLYRRSVRVSMGHVLHVPFAQVDTLATAFELLHVRGFTTIALTPDSDAEDLRDLQVDRAGRVAVLLGAEGPGLSGAALAGAHHRARVAMHDGVDSLNVAAAGAIALHELAVTAGRPGR